MSNKDFKLSSDYEIQKRSRPIKEFLEKIISEDEIPYFVSDDATIFDICLDEENILSQKIFETCGVKPSSEQLQLKLWQLIDLLATKKS